MSSPSYKDVRVVVNEYQERSRIPGKLFTIAVGLDIDLFFSFSGVVGSIRGVHT